MNEGAVSSRVQFTVRVQYPVRTGGRCCLMSGGCNTGWIRSLLSELIFWREKNIRASDLLTWSALLWLIEAAGKMTQFCSEVLPNRAKLTPPPPMTGRDTNSQYSRITLKKKQKKKHTHKQREGEKCNIFPQGDHIYCWRSERTEEIREWKPQPLQLRPRTNPETPAALPSTVTWCHEQVRWSGRKVLTSVKTPRLSGSSWKSRGTVHSDAPSHHKDTMDTVTQVKERIFTVFSPTGKKKIITGPTSWSRSAVCACVLSFLLRNPILLRCAFSSTSESADFGLHFWLGSPQRAAGVHPSAGMGTFVFRRVCLTFCVTIWPVGGAILSHGPFIVVARNY